MDRIEKAIVLIFFSFGLFVFLFGVYVFFFGEPVVMTFGTPWTPSDREPVAIERNFHIAFGFPVMVTGLVALATPVLFLFGDSSNLKQNKQPN